MPLAIEQFDLSAYDLVISSSYAVAKGVITGPNQFHVSYIHSPPRYAWDLQSQYLKESNCDRGFKSVFARLILHYARIWDHRTASGPDVVIANSGYIARRIRKIYGRDSTVIYPPVDIEKFTVSETSEDFYLIASRLVPYKRVPLVVEAFKLLPEKRLVIIGNGPEMAKVKAAAVGSNIEVLGYQPDAVLTDYMRRAKAFVYAAEEDFGIVPVEAQACGKPVIAFGRGGSLETIRGLDVTESTGLFFHEQTPQAIASAILEFEAIRSRDLEQFSPAACRRNAMRFSTERFDREFRSLIDSELKRYFVPQRVNGVHLEVA
jgi:glycosyltransferase involved in cell wall biosynthesis